MKRGFLLMNTGSPEAPTEEALRVYLREFLMDPYVIDLPFPLRVHPRRRGEPQVGLDVQRRDAAPRVRDHAERRPPRAEGALHALELVAPRAMPGEQLDDGQLQVDPDVGLKAAVDADDLRALAAVPDLLQ